MPTSVSRVSWQEWCCPWWILLESAATQKTAAIVIVGQVLAWPELHALVPACCGREVGDLLAA